MLPAAPGKNFDSRSAAAAVECELPHILESCLFATPLLARNGSLTPMEELVKKTMLFEATERELTRDELCDVAGGAIDDWANLPTPRLYADRQPVQDRPNPWFPSENYIKGHH